MDFPPGQQRRAEFRRYQAQIAVLISFPFSHQEGTQAINN
jgi:hypothetical protein